MSFELLEFLNEAANAELARRTILMKVIVVQGPTSATMNSSTKVLDVKTIDPQNVLESSVKQILQVLAQFKQNFTFEFDETEKGMLNELMITAEATKVRDKMVQFKIDNLTDSEVSEIKKNLLRYYMRNRSLT